MAAQPHVVIVTETGYVTVTPTQVATVPTSLSPTFSSSMAGRSSSAELSILPGSMMHNTSSSATALSSLPTGAPPLTSGFAGPGSHQPRFNDTFAIVVLVAVILMGILLCGLLGYVIYLRCKGECPKCNGLKQQLGKWERGDLKRITTDMVRKREALNDGSSAGSAVDLEKGVVGESRQSIEDARAAALSSLEGRDKAPFWNGVKETVQNAKGKVTGKENGMKNVPPPIQTRESSIVDRFFKVQVESPPLPQGYTVEHAPQVHYEPSDHSFYNPPSPSTYSQSTVINDGPRMFGNHTAPSMPQPGRLRRDSAKHPSGYTAYLANVWGPRDKEREIQQAEAGLLTPAYKTAERAMQRDSTTESEMQSALKIVNKADQEVQRARHPSLYSELPHPTTFEDVKLGHRDDEVSAVSSYKPAHWRAGQREDGFF